MADYFSYDFRELIPFYGDSVTIVNIDGRYQVIVHAHTTSLTLTEEDLNKLMSGEIVYQ